MAYGIIYKIENITNGKCYVGQTRQSIRRRWIQHTSSSRRGSSFPIHKAMTKYGIENFSIHLLCEGSSKEDLDEKEEMYGSKENALSPRGYSLKFGGSQTSFSDELRQKLSDNHANFRGEKSPLFGKPGLVGEKNPLFGKRGSLHPSYGRVLSEGEIQKRTQTRKISYPSTSEEAKEKIGKSNAKKTYYFISPGGDEIVIRNMKKFCRDNNLNDGAMIQVALGKKRHHKGWKKDEQLTHP